MEIGYVKMEFFQDIFTQEIQSIGLFSTKRKGKHSN